MACTEAKQTEEPFNKTTNRVMKPSELTHIDVWGKYRVASINGNQYYTIFVDDAQPPIQALVSVFTQVPYLDGSLANAPESLA